MPERGLGGGNWGIWDEKEVWMFIADRLMEDFWEEETANEQRRERFAGFGAQIGVSPVLAIKKRAG
jgi:hypothetical protein